MSLNRRQFLAVAGAAALAPLGVVRHEPPTSTHGATMYGLIGKMIAVEGQRDALAAILLEASREMPGCLSYVVAADPAEPDALWITEVWDRRESHEASLGLPAVQAAIAKGRPLIAGFGERIETAPIGGVGLAAAGAS